MSCSNDSNIVSLSAHTCMFHDTVPGPDGCSPAHCHFALRPNCSVFWPPLLRHSWAWSQVSRWSVQECWYRDHYLDTLSSLCLSFSLSSVPSEHSVIPLVLGFLRVMPSPLSAEVAVLLGLSLLSVSSMVNTIPSSLWSEVLALVLSFSKYSPQKLVLWIMDLSLLMLKAVKSAFLSWKVHSQWILRILNDLWRTYKLIRKYHNIITLIKPSKVCPVKKWRRLTEYHIIQLHSCCIGTINVFNTSF